MIWSTTNQKLNGKTTTGRVQTKTVMEKFKVDAAHQILADMKITNTYALAVSISGWCERFLAWRVMKWQERQ